MKEEEAREIANLIKLGKMYHYTFENGDADSYETIRFAKGKFLATYGTIPWDCNSKSDYLKKEFDESGLVKHLIENHKYEQIKEYLN